MSGERICPICGKSFSRKGKRVYCSDECAQEGHKKNSYAAQKVRVAKRREGKERKCPVCGKPVPRNMKKYCSHECAKKAQLQQCRESYERRKRGEQARKKKWETVGDKRPCHGCGKPSYNYWCPACWRKRAQKYGIPEEDVPGVRCYNEEVE